jgi:diguanylate cyclase (GGDEF)-like protein
MLLDTTLEQPGLRSDAQSAAENERLAALDEYDILDTSEEEIFDRITRMARQLFNVDMSMITFVDGHRQWFKSRQGVDYCEGPKGPSFCNKAVNERAPLIITNAATDERFRDNPLVTGAPFIRFYAGVPLYSHSGYAIGTFCVIDTKPAEMPAERLDLLRDLADMAKAALELRRVATVDALTGASTRRAFCGELQKALSLACRHGHDVSLLAFDLDHFKRINDTYGHHAGDAVLTEALRICRAHLRDSDLVGRLGGEEFAVLLPHTDGHEAMAVSEKLRQALEAANLVIDGAPIKITASFGVVSGETAKDVGPLLEIADKAVYAAKRSGRNRSVAAQFRSTPELDVSRRVLKSGTISFRGGTLTTDCTVRRLSAVGAELQVSEHVNLPERFKLRIDADGLSKMCAITSRNGTKVTVTFG